MPPSLKARAGLSAADVIVGLGLVSVVFLFLIMGLTRSREAARLAACQRNLAQIGQAMTYYDGNFGGLPPVAVPVGRVAGTPPPGPLKEMLDGLGVASFLGLDVKGGGLGGSRGIASEGVPVAGFICPADRPGLELRFPSPTSYRACTGSDPAGNDGPFPLGRRGSLGEVDRRDGLAYTAGFAERLIGDGRPEPAPWNYFVPPGDEGADKVKGAEGASWSGDAGSTWAVSDFRYTLYNHWGSPNASRSWVARDGRSSTMGASSAHVRGVDVLALDGSVRIVAPSIDPDVWKAFGSVGSETGRTDTEK